MYRGYVKLWRKLEDSDIFRNEKALKIWIWILIRANHQENTVLFGRQKIYLNKGEFIMGLNKASEHLNLAKSTIHFWVNYLNDLEMVELKKTNKYTIIKVKNWSDYQGTETQTELQKNSKRTLKETNNNDKECIKNDKELNTVANATPSLKLGNEIYTMEELTYEPLEGSTKKSKYGRQTMATLAKKYAECSGIEIKDSFDASAWAKPLSAIYNYFEKDADKAMAYIEKAVSYFDSKALSHTPQTLHKSLPLIDKWMGENKLDVSERRKL